MNSSDLEYFLEVSKTNNVTRAAERLGITQPSLSLALQRLEANLGVKLLVRGKTGVQLTRAGQRVANESRDLLEKWDQIKKIAKDEETEISGRFTLGCHPSVGLYTLHNFLPHFLSDNAKIEIRLKHGLSREITEDIISWRIDFGIVVNPVEHPDLVIIELATDNVTLWKSSKLLNPETLIVEPDLLQTQNLMKDLNKRKISFSRIMESSNLEVISSLVQEGCGVGILPERVIKRAQAEGIKKWGANAPVFQDRICLVFRQDSQSTESARTIISAIKAAKF